MDTPSACANTEYGSQEIRHNLRLLVHPVWAHHPDQDSALPRDPSGRAAGHALRAHDRVLHQLNVSCRGGAPKGVLRLQPTYVQPTSASIKDNFNKILLYHAKFKLYKTDKNGVNFLKEWNEIVRAKEKDRNK